MFDFTVLNVKMNLCWNQSCAKSFNHLFTPKQNNRPEVKKDEKMLLTCLNQGLIALKGEESCELVGTQRTKLSQDKLLGYQAVGKSGPPCKTSENHTVGRTNGQQLRQQQRTPRACCGSPQLTWSAVTCVRAWSAHITEILPGKDQVGVVSANLKIGQHSLTRKVWCPLPPPARCSHNFVILIYPV